MYSYDLGYRLSVYEKHLTSIENGHVLQSRSCDPKKSIFLSVQFLKRNLLELKSKTDLLTKKLRYILLFVEIAQNFIRMMISSVYLSFIWIVILG